MPRTPKAINSSITYHPHEGVAYFIYVYQQKTGMRIISTKLHAILDYCIALLSILSPVLFHFGTGQFETILPLAFGLLIILYSFFTDYALGLSKQIPFYLHVRMDQLAALLMISSPWVFNFKEVVYLPHVLLGLALLVNSLLAGNDIIVVFQSLRQRLGASGDWLVARKKPTSH